MATNVRLATLIELVSFEAEVEAITKPALATILRSHLTQKKAQLLCIPENQSDYETLKEMIPKYWTLKQ